MFFCFDGRNLLLVCHTFPCEVSLYIIIKLLKSYFILLFFFFFLFSVSYIDWVLWSMLAGTGFVVVLAFCWFQPFAIFRILFQALNLSPYFSSVQLLPTSALHHTHFSVFKNGIRCFGSLLSWGFTSVFCPQICLGYSLVQCDSFSLCGFKMGNFAFCFLVVITGLAYDRDVCCTDDWLHLQECEWPHRDPQITHKVGTNLLLEEWAPPSALLLMQMSLPKRSLEWCYGSCILMVVFLWL